MGRAALLVALGMLASCSRGGGRSVEPEVVHVRIEPPPPPARTQPEDRRAPQPSAIGVLKPPRDRTGDQAACDLELELGLENSVLAEHHDRNGWQDFHLRFPAYPVDPQTFDPVQATSGFTIEGRPILWFTPDGNRVVVDHTFARDLEAVDAFALPAGATVPIGTIEAEGMRMAASAWAELLLRARIAATWAEGPAELCIDWRNADGEAFDAYVMGERVAADGASEPIHFLLRIDVDRSISVVGLPR